MIDKKLFLLLALILSFVVLVFSKIYTQETDDLKTVSFDKSLISVVLSH